MAQLRTDASTGQSLAAIGRGQAQRLTVLDSVRGIAAMVVVVHHCLLTQPAFSDYFTRATLTKPTGKNGKFGGVAGLRGRLSGWQRHAVKLGSGLVDHSQKMTVAAMQMADMKVWAQRS